MPKKTKKEKIIAEYRRKLKAVSFETAPQGVSAKPLQTAPSPAPSAYQYFQPNPKQQEETATVIDETDLPFIRRDMAKTLVLTVIALTIEFLLYWNFRS